MKHIEWAAVILASVASGIVAGLIGAAALMFFVICLVFNTLSHLSQ